MELLSQGVAKVVNSGLHDVTSYIPQGSQRVAMSRRDKFLYLRLLVTMIARSRNESQGVANKIFSRFPYDCRELQANLITFIATCCNSLRPHPVIWKLGLSKIIAVPFQDGNLLQTCKNCRALQECKLPAAKELPFLWVPTSKIDTNEFSWPFNSDTHASNPTVYKQRSCHDMKNGRREPYKTLKAMFSEDQTKFNVRADHMKDASIQKLPLRNIICKGLQSIIDSQRLIQGEVVKSAIENKEKQEIFSYNIVKQNMNVGRKQRNVRTLHFSKNKHVRLSKEKQFQKAKKVPGAQELAMERIADNLIEQVL